MAKSDSFFIRAQVPVDVSPAYSQTEIDLGSFVNLGVSKSTLLRIHTISVQYADDTGVELPIYSLAAAGAKIGWQLTTQSQTALVLADDKSMAASGSLTVFGDPTSTTHAISTSESQDVNPQQWRNGYLIAVDSMFLGSDVGGTLTSGSATINVIIECTLENATQASSTALALSQQ